MICDNCGCKNVIAEYIDIKGITVEKDFYPTLNVEYFAQCNNCAQFINIEKKIHIDIHRIAKENTP